jgi:broad specificity phosphatase PhoE
MSATLKVHLVRHGEVASHRGDIPVTEAGLAQAEAAGRRLGEDLVLDETVSFLYAPTRRALETATAIRKGVADFLGPRKTELRAPAREWALRNPDLYVAGSRVEMVSTPEALASQITAPGLGAGELSGLPFFKEFWAASDRIGYWVCHPDPPGEDADTVARRLLAFAVSLLDVPSVRPRRYVCVTHSPVLRAFLRRYLLGEDPGEPGYVEPIDLIFHEPPTVSFRGRRRDIAVGAGRSRPSEKYPHFG